MKALFLAALSLIIVGQADPLQAQTEAYRLDNGMQVILKEQHGAPMIASVIFVKSGSAYESQFENGITHLLEHLLFDGTVHLSREQLDRSISDLGGYINAFTRKELTGYLVLLPKQFIDYGMAVQADMLFNSTMPESELAKERQVVIEEIKREMDSPGAPAEAFFTERAYGHTPYGRPVLGYESFIANISRDAIVQYWKRYYRPSNMVMLLIGDFDSAEMKARVAAVFGSIPDTATSSSEISESMPIDGAHRFDTVAAVTSTYINFSIEAPRFGHSTYLPMDLLAQYLNLDEVSPLKQALMGQEPLASEVAVSLTSYPTLSRLEITIVSEDAANRDKIVDMTLATLRGIGANAGAIDSTALTGLKTTVRTQDIYNAEKLHYYGFMIAPMLMTAGWEFIQHYPGLLNQVTWPEMQQAAQSWLDDPDYVVTVVRPIEDSTAARYLPSTLSAHDVKAFFDSVQFEQPDLAQALPIQFLTTDSVSLAVEDRAAYKRAVLDNGLTVLIKSSPDSRVFAITALGKNRSRNEADSLAGITDFVNRCLEQGTTTRPATRLSTELARIGATVSLYDNPWIPYDDRYTTPQFSFFKFETIDEFAYDGLALFADMLQNPAFDTVEIEKIRQSMLGIIAREATTPTTVARRLFMRGLHQSTKLDKPTSGLAETIGRITPTDLRGHHARFYAPNNIILAIATSRDTTEIFEWVVRRFAHVRPDSTLPIQTPVPQLLQVSQQEHVELAKEQIGIYLGGFLPGARDSSSVALEVALSMLSNRLYSSLRERQGLAYSVGAGSAFSKDFGWWYCSMGTSADKFEQAYNGILLEIDKLKLDGPAQSELNQARNGLWGRLMSAKLSRINQAYYMAVNEFLGNGPAHDPLYLASLSQVTLYEVAQAMRRHVRTDAIVTATAGRRAGE